MLKKYITAFTAAQKAQAALETLEHQRTIPEIAHRYGVDAGVLNGWTRQLRNQARTLFDESGEGAAPESLSARRQQIGEDERERLARAIHEDLGQTLTALRLDVSALHMLSSGRHQRLHSRTGAALDNLDAALASLKAIVKELRPFALELGLLPAIDWQLKEFQHLSGIDCRLTVTRSALAYELAQQPTLTMFRILQEALSNIGRHARAGLAEVTVRHDDDVFSMEIRDNGIGMHAADRAKANVSGLAVIQRRVAALGGELQIDSRAGAGTVLRVRIPAASAATAAGD